MVVALWVTIWFKWITTGDPDSNLGQICFP